MFKSIYNSIILLEELKVINELYPFYDPYKFYESYYFELYSNFMRSPSMYNKGKLESAWEIMVNVLGQRANVIKNKMITKFNSNPHR